MHSHADTTAEAMTTHFVSNFGGSSILGKFTLGNRRLVSQGNMFKAAIGTTVLPISPDEESVLTFPLYGQNVINWRNSDRTHNNVPPSTNIYVRYSKTQANNIGYGSRKGSVPVANGVDDIPASRWSVAEAQYQSLAVPELDGFGKNDLTSHDYLLRVGMDGDSVKLMKQEV